MRLIMRAVALTALLLPACEAAAQGYGRDDPGGYSDNDGVGSRRRGGRSDYDERRDDAPDYDRGGRRPSYDPDEPVPRRSRERDRGFDQDDDAISGQGRGGRSGGRGDTAPAPREPQAAPAAVARGEPLYVGTQAGCNAGEVSTSSSHKGCATQPIGSTVSLERAGGSAAPLYVGTTPGRNAGSVSIFANQGGGASRIVGYLVPAQGGRTRLFVGTASCNNGIVTTSPNHLGCATREIGFTAR